MKYGKANNGTYAMHLFHSLIRNIIIVFNNEYKKIYLKKIHIIALIIINTQSTCIINENTICSAFII